MLKRLLSLTALAALAVVPIAQPVARAEPAAVSWTAVSAALVTCGSCLICSPSTYHKNGEGETVDNPHNWCINSGSDCASSHPKCGASRRTTNDVILAKLTEEALDGSLPALRRLVSEYPQQAEINTERSAIQVISECNYLAVDAHIPVSGEVLEALVEIRAETTR